MALIAAILAAQPRDTVDDIAAAHTDNGHGTCTTCAHPWPCAPAAAAELGLQMRCRP